MKFCQTYVWFVLWVFVLNFWSFCLFYFQYIYIGYYFMWSVFCFKEWGWIINFPFDNFNASPNCRAPAPINYSHIFKPHDHVHTTPTLIIRLKIVYPIGNFSIFLISKWTLLSPAQGLNQTLIFIARIRATILISHG